MQLVVVRHGRTAWNAERRFQGHTDVPLDDEGRAQATALAALLAAETFASAVTSDLARAQETARIVLGARTLPLRIDPDWREMRFGTWEGLTWPEIVAAHPELDAANETAPRVYTPSGGESFDDLCARIDTALARVIRETPDDGSALIATHAGPLHAMLRVLLGGDQADALKVRFLTASVSRFARVDGRWSLAALNQTGYEPA